MNHLQKQTLFSQFHKTWELQFNKIPAIIDYLLSYPEVSEKLKNVKPVTIDELRASQLEWVSLVARLNTPLESDFFKPYWVPIQSEKYSIFIDLSSESFPIFNSAFFPLQPYRWFKEFIISNTPTLLLDLNNPKFSIKSYQQKLEEKNQNQIDSYFSERSEMGLAGKLEPSILDKDDIINTEFKTEHQIIDNTLYISGVFCRVMGLLPFDTKIKLHTIEHQPYPVDDSVCYVLSKEYPADSVPNSIKQAIRKITNVKAFLYFLQGFDNYNIVSYKFSFEAFEGCFAEYKKDEFILRHSDNQLLINVEEKFLSYLKTATDK